jgi:DNA-binding CsgD family transcriptional regulator
MRSFDAISLLELAYRNQADTGAWLQALARATVPQLGAEWLGGIGFIARGSEPPEAASVAVVASEHSGLDDSIILQMAFATRSCMPAEHLERVERTMSRPGVASILDLVDAVPEGLSAGWPVVVRDSHGVFIPLGDGRAVVLANVCAKPSTIDVGSRRLWRRLAIHLAAGCRLVGRRDSMEAPDVEAVVEAGGRVVHAAGAAEGRDERELLEAAARDLDRARTRAGRQDAVAALELWQGLLAGRWSLVEHFDSDGKRFLLARRNDPDSPHPRTLSGRQRQVAFYASLGWSNSEIAYALGISENTASTHLHHALIKLGLSSRAELVKLTTQMESASARSS